MHEPCSLEHEYAKKLQTADKALLSPVAGVVTSRGLVRYVVTEHGVAYLHGNQCEKGPKH